MLFANYEHHDYGSICFELYSWTLMRSVPIDGNAPFSFREVRKCKRNKEIAVLFRQNSAKY